MINELIKEIVYDKITVSQCLTRTKLIARQIKNETFTDWLNKELNGYKKDDPLLPEYRKVYSETQLTAEFPFGRTKTYPVVLQDDQKHIEDMINHHHFTEPLLVIEQNIKQMGEEKGEGYIYLTGSQLQMVTGLYKEHLAKYNGVINSGVKHIGKSQLINIVELVKQKLIDTLQDLEEQFPNIDNKYELNDDNVKKALGGM